MGCCQSDLKGETQGDGTDAATAYAPQPIKKVKTNFSTIDYDAGASHRRDTVVDPHELLEKSDPSRPKSSTDHPPDQIASTTPGGDRAGTEDPLQDKITQDPVPGSVAVDAHKEPYKDVTASPTTPGVTNPPDAHLAPSDSPADKAETGGDTLVH